MFLLDYIIPFTLLGLAGIFPNPLRNKKSFILGITLGSFLRYLSHAFSGVIVWSYYADLAGFNPWLYSFVIYNLPYMAASFALCIVIGLIFFERKIFTYHLDEFNSISQ